MTTLKNDENDENDTILEDNSGIKIYESFEDIGLKDNLLRGIYAQGYEKPSLIQQKAIKPFLEGGDLIAQSQSGTGKTATFVISVLESIVENKGTQAIIVAHTRELALQIYGVSQSLNQYLKYGIVLLTGGTSVNQNIEELRKNPHIVISTPGRLLDMLNKRKISNRDMKYIVIDEADELLSSGFINQIYDIFNFLRDNNLQVALYSATMPKEFFDISKKMMRDPKKILVKTEELTLEGIKQFYVNVERNEYKFDVLCDLYGLISVSQSIIYCNSKKMVNELSYNLSSKNFTVASIHSDMSQEERSKIVQDFRNGESRILISTDLLSRGIDVQQVSIVINYDVPSSIDNYIHRIGRSGRFGRKGVAINLITFTDISRLHDIEKFYSTVIEELPENFMEFL
jgi:superfamily II DNA/RNA helicase